MVKESNLLSEKEWEVAEDDGRVLSASAYNSPINRFGYVIFKDKSISKDIIGIGFKSRESGVILILDGDVKIDSDNEVYCFSLSTENFLQAVEMNVIDSSVWDVIVCRGPKA